MDILNDIAQLKPIPTDLGVYDSAINDVDKITNSFSLPQAPSFVVPETPVDTNISPDVLNIIKGLQNNVPQPHSEDLTALAKAGSGDSIPKSDFFKVDKNVVTPDMLPDFTYKNLLGETKLKYDTYEYGRNNEEIQALKQTRLEKWGKGLTSMLGKSLVHAVGGTVGLGVGIQKWIEEGNIKAFYDNDFAKSLDRLNESLDNSLAVYKTQEEENMNILQKMGTASFWAKDMTDVGAFMLGAVIVGKGTGLLTRGLPKVATKLAARSGMQAVKAAETVASTAEKARLMSTIKSPIKQLLHSMTNGGSTLRGGVFGVAQNANNIGKLVKGINTFGQVTMSATYEAGVEARQALQSMIDNYVRQYREFHGEDPSEEEYSAFVKDAVDKSNIVFLSNIPLVALGNYATVGRIIGWQTPKFLQRVGKALNPVRWGEKTALAGVSRAGSTFAFEAPKGFAKFGKKFYSLMEAPIKEGLIEEGGQNFVSTFAQNYMATKYDPTAGSENLSFMGEMSKALYEAYGTKNGWNQIGVGMLIGLLGSQAGRATEAHRSGKSVGQSIGAFFTSDYTSELKRGETFVDEYKKITEENNKQWLSQEQFDSFNRLASLNQQRVADKKAELSKDERELSMINRANQLAQYRLAREYGMEDFIGEQMKSQIDSLSTEDLNELGVKEPQHQEYKDFLKEQVDYQLKVNEQAYDIAENLHENLMSQGQLEEFAKMNVSQSDLVFATALELSMGYDAVERTQQLAKDLEDLFGNEGAGNAVLLRQHLSETKFKQLEEKNKLIKEQEQLSEKQKELENVLLAERNRTVTDQKQIEKNAEIKNTKLNEVLEQISQNEQKIREVDNKIQALNYRQNRLETIDANTLLGGITKGLEFWGGIVNSQSELDNAYSKLQELDDVVKGAREELNDPNTSNSRKKELEGWLDRYAYLVSNLRQNVSAYKILHDNFIERTNPRYAYSKFKEEALFNKRKNDKVAELEENAPDWQKELWKKVEEIVENSELNDYQAYQFKANAKIYIKQVALDLEKSSEISEVIKNNTEVISDDVWQKVEDGEDVEGLNENIADKINSKTPLSQRELAIYAKNKSEIDNIVERLQIENGDPMSFGFSSGQDTNTVINRAKTFKDALKDIIDDFIKTNNRLSQEIVDKAEKPTTQDYERFRELHRKKTGRDENGRMTDQKTREKLISEFEENEQEYETLRNKLNNWGIVAGTVANGVRLSDIIEVYDSIQENENLSPEKRIKQTEINLDELLDESESGAEWQPTNRGRNYRIGQVYDIAMVSKNKNGNYVLHHYGIDSLIDDVKAAHPDSQVEVFGIPHTAKTRPIYESEKKKTYKGVEFRITGEDSSVIRFVVDFDGERNNLVFGEEAIPHLGNLRIMQIPAISRNYQPLYRENEDGTFEQVQATFDGGIDNVAAREVKRGDKLSARIVWNDPYNTTLLQNYKKAQRNYSNNPNEETKKVMTESRERLASQVVIQLLDDSGRVVSVMKSNPSADELKENLTAPEMLAYRNRVVNEVDEAISNKRDTGTMNLTDKMSVVVEETLLGVPNIRVGRSDEGNVVVRLQPLTEQTKEKVVDVGYMQDDKIHSKNNTKATTGLNLLNQYRNEQNKSKKIPLIFLKENGEVVAYPAHLQSQGDLLQQFDSILENNDVVQASILLNKLLFDNGISTQLFGVTPDMISENSVELQNVRQQAEKAQTYNDPVNWVKGDMTLEEVLDRDIQVNLDMERDAFSAPKLVFDFGLRKGKTIVEKVKTQDSGTISDELTPSVISLKQVSEKEGGKKKTKVYKDKLGNTYEDYYEGVSKPFEWKGKKYQVTRIATLGTNSMLILLDNSSKEVITQSSIMKDPLMSKAVNEWVQDNVGKTEPSPIVTLEEKLPKSSKPENKQIASEVTEPSLKTQEEKEKVEKEVERAVREVSEELKENNKVESLNQVSTQKEIGVGRETSGKLTKINRENVQEIEKPIEMASQVVEKRNKC
jgi:hypothetical protein